MSDTHELTAEVERCWREVRGRVEGLDLTTPVYPDPVWTVRDVLILCAFWNDESTRAIQEHLRGDAYLTDTGAASFGEGLDAMAREITCPWNERKPVPDMVRDELGHELGHIQDVITAVSAQEDPSAS